MPLDILSCFELRTVHTAPPLPMRVPVPSSVRCLREVVANRFLVLQVLDASNSGVMISFVMLRIVSGNDSFHFPPLTLTKAPVTNDALSLNNQTMASATSSGWPPRPIGMVLFRRSTRPGSPPLACMSV